MYFLPSMGYTEVHNDRSSRWVFPSLYTCKINAERSKLKTGPTKPLSIWFIPTLLFKQLSKTIREWSDGLIKKWLKDSKTISIVVKKIGGQ